MPDYSLYPDIDYSLGFTTRGCIRNCDFCVVPQKEGRVRKVQHPSEFHDPKFSKIMLLDNNITSLNKGKWFFEVTDWINDEKLQCDFQSGIDIRLMTPEIAERIKETKTFKPWKFAYDNTKDTDAILAGIEMLKAAGVNPRQCLFYVYVHDDDDVPIKAAHCDILKMHGATAYSMVNRDVKQTHDMRKIARYTRPMLFWTKNDRGDHIQFWDYCSVINSDNRTQSLLEMFSGNCDGDGEIIDTEA